MVHEKVLAAYKEAGMEYYMRAEDYNQQEFFFLANESKQPIKREIWKVIRVKKNGVEWFYFQEELTSKDSLGRKIHCYKSTGFYDLPEFEYQVDTQTNQRFASGVESTERIYELK
jgi:hypothetical protein